MSHRVFTQIPSQQVTGLSRSLQSQVIIMNWLSPKCYLPKQYWVPLCSFVFLNFFFQFKWNRNTVHHSTEKQHECSSPAGKWKFSVPNSRVLPAPFSHFEDLCLMIKYFKSILNLVQAGIPRLDLSNTTKLALKQPLVHVVDTSVKKPNLCV